MKSEMERGFEQPEVEYTDLQHLDHRVRLHAVGRVGRDLSKTDPKGLLEHLKPLLCDPHAQVRALSALVLGDCAIVYSEVLQELAEISSISDDNKPSRRARIAGLSALSRAGRRMRSDQREGEVWEGACKACLSALDSSYADTRFQGMMGLVRLGAHGEGAVSAARRSLQESDQELVAMAAELLVMSDDQASLPALEEASARLSGEPYRQLLLSLSALLVSEENASSPPQIVRDGIRERIIDALLGEARKLPYGLQACEVLGVIGDEAVRGELTKLLGGWFVHRLIRVAAAAAVAKLGGEEGRLALRKAMGHRKRDARGFALECAGRLAEPTLLPVLYGVLQDPGDYHSDTAAYALGFVESEESTLALERALSDRRTEVRLEAARGLGQRTTLSADVRATLETIAAHDPDQEVRDAASGLEVM